MTNWIQSEDFTLSTSQTISGVKFWDFQNAHSYNGSISWFIYSDKSGVPGSILDQGNVAATRTSTGMYVPAVLFRISRTTSRLAALTLGPGTYPLAYTMGQSQILRGRSFTGRPLILTALQRRGTQSADRLSLEQQCQEHAFELLSTTATPEPGSFLLFGLGGIALGSFRRFRRR